MSQDSLGNQPRRFKIVEVPSISLYAAEPGIAHTITILEGNYIITGPASELDQLVKKARDEKQIESFLVGELVLEYIRPLLSDGAEIPWYDALDVNDSLVMRLYKMAVPDAPSPPASDWELKLVDEIRQLTTSGHVHIDLDYLVDGIYGDPWTGEGGPWGESEPYDSQANKLEVAQATFQEQWAFGDTPGIALNPDPVPPDQPTGEGVRVGIFDTSPDAMPGPKVYDWATPPLNLEIKELAPFPGISIVVNQANEALKPPFDPEDHGLFVAGLVHSVAPQSEVHLYRVLDKRREGDLFTLNYALHTFIQETLEKGDSLKGAVINLSLGSTSLPGPSASALSPRAHLQPVSLHTLLTAAHLSGIVVTAAAGNHGHMRAAQTPAGSPDVLGVAASNRQGEQACFSQNGKVLAPGGGASNSGCKRPKPAECRDLWLMSLVSKRRGFRGWLQAIQRWLRRIVTPSQSSQGWYFPLPSGYAYAAGTSFSTPLVSGLAALVFDAGARKTATGWDWISSNEVHEIIQSSGQGHKGIVHVPTAIARVP